MPIISKISAKSPKVRLLYALIYTLLIVGSVSMLYPFLLMLTGSVQSEADANQPSPYPRYWFDDVELFRKFVESKYDVDLNLVQQEWQEEIPAWQQIEKPPEVDANYLRAFLDWRSQCPGWRLGHTRGGRMLPINGRLFRDELYARFHGDINAMSKTLAVPLKNWGAVLPPSIELSRYSGSDQPYLKAWEDFTRTRPVDDRIIPNPDGDFRAQYLVPKYTPDIANYNAAHGTNYNSYSEVFLTRRAPPAGLAQKDWEDFVRNDLKLQYILLSPPLPATPPADGAGQSDWERLLQNRAACPTDQIEVVGPRQDFEEFLARRNNIPLANVPHRPLPIAQADWHDMMLHHADLRWEFTTRNYKNVMGYLALHGRGIVNTLIYCVLAILTALFVNPLAAYALSRYRPPETLAVLLFCMATMAFPAEVTMIPSFLLLKRFPLGGLACGGIVMFVSAWLLGKFRPAWPQVLRLTVSLALAIAAGAWALPQLAGQTHISLLNTFAALVLPGMANGFSIFLLKGFFDSLPGELFEAAAIDGAGQWTMFWVITMSLSKPILAVIALAAFTGAYSAFMMALVIIPDQKMWTIMVWLFELQNSSHQSVVYASLVIAAIPTFLVFALCQNLIMRGIVVPVEK